MKRVIAWLTGIVGIAALCRMLARRRHAAGPDVEQPPVTAPDDPAEELRRRLAARRQPDGEIEQAAPSETLEERRERVHAKAREAIDAMDDDGPVA
jgi:hypothetical protein